MTKEDVQMSSELDLFRDLPVQMNVEEYRLLSLNPQNTIMKNAPITFHYAGNADDYLDMTYVVLELKVRILDHEEKALRDDFSCTLVNNALNSLFQQVEVSLNNVIVSMPQPGYPYRTYMETLLNYSEDAMNTKLEAALWKKDTAGIMDSFTANAGFLWRNSHTKGSKVVQLMGYLSNALFRQENVLLNNVNLTIKLTPSSPQFHLFTENQDFRGHTEIQSATLHLKAVRPSPTIKLAHQTVLQKSNAKYHLKDVSFHALSIPKGSSNMTFTDVFVGQIPRRVVVAMVADKAYNGNYNTNPYHLQHFNINSFQMYVNGQPFPSQPLQPDFENGHYMQCFQTLQDGLGIHFKDEGHSIPRAHYQHGYFVMAFDLTADMSANETYVSGQHHGSVSISIGFAKQLAEPVILLVLAELHRTVEIDANRSVLVS